MTEPKTIEEIDEALGTDGYAGLDYKGRRNILTESRLVCCHCGTEDEEWYYPFDEHCDGASGEWTCCDCGCTMEVVLYVTYNLDITVKKTPPTTKEFK